MKKWMAALLTMAFFLLMTGETEAKTVTYTSAKQRNILTNISKFSSMKYKLKIKHMDPDNFFTNVNKGILDTKSKRFRMEAGYEVGRVNLLVDYIYDYGKGKTYVVKSSLSDQVNRAIEEQMKSMVVDGADGVGEVFGAITSSYQIDRGHQGKKKGIYETYTKKLRTSGGGNTSKASVVKYVIKKVKGKYYPHSLSVNEKVKEGNKTYKVLYSYLFTKFDNSRIELPKRAK